MHGQEPTKLVRVTARVVSPPPYRTRASITLRDYWSRARNAGKSLFARLRHALLDANKCRMNDGAFLRSYAAI
jgi:hypothetical protein